LFSIQQRNGQPIVPGSWRKKAYPSRTYDPITDYVFTSSIPSEEASQLSLQLNTSLNGFVGQSYNYDDHDLTEMWMTSFIDSSSSSQPTQSASSTHSGSKKGVTPWHQPSEDDVIHTQLETLMDILVAAVQDRVCTSDAVLDRPLLVLGEDIKEVPVWGIDCYCRRMLELTIEDALMLESTASSRSTLLPAQSPSAKKKQPDSTAPSSTTSLVASRIREFIEKKVLPTINAQSSEDAHSMRVTMNAIQQVQRELYSIHISCI
jgi:hypothetical protein